MPLPSIDKHNAEPVTSVNAPFLPEIDYRSDDYSSLRFKMLEHMRESFPHWNPDLADNTQRRDMGVAFVELFAYLGEILSFYQDRRANEAFLRTAVLRSSLIDLCELIDYRLGAGSSSATQQVFLGKEGQNGTVPARFQVKTAPANGRPSLIFETEQDLSVAEALNELRLFGYNRSTRRLNEPGRRSTSTVLLDQGYGGLEAGSYVVFSAPKQTGYPVQLTAVTEEDEKRRIHWKASELPAGADLPVADLEIHGKPAQEMFLESRARADEITAGVTRALVRNPALLQGLDAVLFDTDGLQQGVRLLHVAKNGLIIWNRPFATSLRRSQTVIYAGTDAGYVSGRLKRGATSITTRSTKGHDAPVSTQAGDVLLVADARGAANVNVASHQSFEIHLAEPLPRPFGPGVQLYRVRPPAEGIAGESLQTTFRPSLLKTGTRELRLDDEYDGLEPGARLVLSDGRAAEVHHVSSARVEDDLSIVRLKSATTVDFVEATLTVYGPFELTMRVDGYDRSEEFTLPGATSLTLAGRTDGLKPTGYVVIEGGGNAESARITTVDHESGSSTALSLESALVHGYPLGETVVFGNVATVSHGETVIEEVLGSGDRSRANQSFTLKRHPTTFVRDAAGARGVANSLEVFVDEQRWKEVESLAESGPDDRTYTVRIDDEQVMTFHFGDDRNGAKLATGVNNVRVRYRVGLGALGNVAADSIVKMPQALPFLDATRNPVGAAGGEDRESPELTKMLAPITVRTLDRAVSLGDYADLALSYAGIAKARADWIREEGRRVVQLVVAAADGQPLTLPLKDALRGFLDARRPPLYPLRIVDHRRVPVRLELDVVARPDFVTMVVKGRVEAALGNGTTEAGDYGFFHFDRLSLGANLYLSDVYSVVENVEGVDYAVARAFSVEGLGNGTMPEDRITIPVDAVASGGAPADETIGILRVRASGGIV